MNPIHADPIVTTIPPTPADPRPLRVVVLGAGVAALEACLALRALAGPRVELVLVAPVDQLEFAPASVGEPFGAASVHRFDLARIAADLGAELLRGTASAVEAERREVLIDGWHALAYDALVVATGALPVGSVPGATMFAGPRDVPAVRAVMDAVTARPGARLLFAVPAGAGWTLPAYELALLAETELARRAGPRLVGIVTPEAAPLSAFGPAAVGEVSALLERRGIEFHGSRTPIEVLGGALWTAPTGRLPADRVVALPRLRGVRIDGLPVDTDGLVRTDPSGRVEGLTDVYAAGDITNFPVKQGGIAAQQADAVAESIAADAGADVRPRPFRPHLRGVLLTGDDERFLSGHLAGGRGDTSSAGREPLWWPPGKVAARHLGPYLAGIETERRLDGDRRVAR